MGKIKCYAYKVSRGFEYLMSYRERYSAEGVFSKVEEHRFAVGGGIALVIFHTTVTRFYRRMYGKSAWLFPSNACAL